MMAGFAVGDHAPNSLGSRQPPGSPARERGVSFGDDEELAGEMPPNCTLRRFQDEVKKCLAEYFVSLALEDTIAQVTELLADWPLKEAGDNGGVATVFVRATLKADELGVIAIRSALDRDEAARNAVVKLLCGLFRTKALDESSLVRSFEKLFCTWEDIAIDAPQAPGALLDILNGCLQFGAIQRALLTKLPESLLLAGLDKASPELRTALKDVAEDLKDFKRKAGRCLEEFYDSFNENEVVTFLRELSVRDYNHEFVKKAITLSFSQANEETTREALLSLLTKLTKIGLLSKDDLHWGITRLLGQLDDLLLDCPRCIELATEFCVAALSGELVSAPFLRRCRLLRIGGASGLQVLEGAQRQKPEYAKKQLCAARFKQEVQTMILEYFNSSDEVEFGRCICEIAPLTAEQSAELVRKVMVFAMERSGTECEQAIKLLVWLCRNEELDPRAVELGFDDMYARMADVKLDVPDAEEMARSFVVEAKKAKVLRSSWPDPEEL